MAVTGVDGAVGGDTGHQTGARQGRHTHTCEYDSRGGTGKGTAPVRTAGRDRMPEIVQRLGSGLDVAHAVVQHPAQGRLGRAVALVAAFLAATARTDGAAA